MNKSSRPAQENEIINTIEPADVIQKHLQQLEIMAHGVHLSMDDMLTLVERQFVVAAIQRNGGNKKAAAKDVGRHRNMIPRILSISRAARRDRVA